MPAHFSFAASRRAVLATAAVALLATAGVPALAQDPAKRNLLIGATAAGVGASQVTPVSPSMAPVLTLAHSVSSILQEHFFVTPTWGVWASLGVFVLVAVYLIALLVVHLLSPKYAPAKV